MTGSILSILGSVFGLIAAWYLNKLYKSWQQRYLDGKEKKALQDEIVKQEKEAVTIEKEVKDQESFEDKWYKTH